MQISRLVLAGSVGLLLVAGSAASAFSGRDHDHEAVRAKLTGYEEVPALSTPARGRFHAVLKDDKIHFTLKYRDLTSEVLQAHIHFGQFGVSGGVSAFLCSNLGNGPAGTAACPSSGEVKGTLTADSVVGPTGQGIAPGELPELLAAIEADVTYVNVHSSVYPTGEIRGQLEEHDD
ncbi:MAG: CHRD domain-containing protein [Nocardioides sp.]